MKVSCSPETKLNWEHCAFLEERIQPSFQFL
jgi:hypothetical protein